MGIVHRDHIGFRDLKKKINILKEKIMDLESRELRDVKIYYSIMQNAYMQFGGLVAISSVMTSVFRELKFFLVLGMIMAFFLCIVYPLYFGDKRLQALKYSNRELIVERKILYRSCISLVTEYDNSCVVASHFKDVQILLLFKEIGEAEMKKFNNFKDENGDLAYKTKYYQKFLLLMGIVGLVYAVAFTSSFYVFFQDVPKVSRHRSFPCCCCCC